ncbi:MAG: hypothetical protein WD276_10060 [Actinomycetota bacterium]
MTTETQHDHDHATTRVPEPAPHPAHTAPTLAGSVLTLIGGFTTVAAQAARDRRLVVVEEDV